MSAGHNAALVYRVVEEIWNGADLGVADLLFAPAYVNHGGLIPDLVRGPEAIKLSVALYRAAFPTLHIAIEEVTADGEMVVLHWTARRTAPAERTRSAPDGTEGCLTGVTRSRVVGGTIRASWTDWDQVGVFHQLGLLPAARAPGTEGEAARGDCDGGGA